MPNKMSKCPQNINQNALYSTKCTNYLHFKSHTITIKIIVFSIVIRFSNYLCLKIQPPNQF